MPLSIDEYMKLNYKKQVIPDITTEGNVCYIASHPDLQGCMAHGDTPEEALANLEEARQLCIETLLEKGQKVPLPESNSSITYDSVVVKIVNISMVEDEQIEKEEYLTVAFQ